MMNWKYDKKIIFFFSTLEFRMESMKIQWSSAMLMKEAIWSNIQNKIYFRLEIMLNYFTDSFYKQRKLKLDRQFHEFYDFVVTDMIHVTTVKRRELLTSIEMMGRLVRRRLRNLKVSRCSVSGFIVCIN